MTDATEHATAIELPSFPFETLSEIAEAESWRKEIHRPLYHIHKWWAQRLGSVFRGILIGALTPAGGDVLANFYEPTGELRSEIVFDPFMGSGTTVGEALKLGLRAVGRDINPVATFAVRTALSRYNRTDVLATFAAIERDVASRIRHFYQVTMPGGGAAEVLYYFWVKVVACPDCMAPVRLFSSYVFARHAYPARHPDARILCPLCGHINHGRYDDHRTRCDACGTTFDPRDAPARGAKATCPECRHTFPILGAVRGGPLPPRHELYAKLVLDRTGVKHYLSTDEADYRLYREAEELLAATAEGLYPVVHLRDGHNTRQAINYGYECWHQFFNARQLLCLGWLGQRIQQIREPALRQLFVCLFSGTLEFNNMFASYKGEGTGAVRHMFSHHVLKPERMPLEANVWGTPKSSGAFSTLFRTRILRALDYQERPFEVAKPRAAAGSRHTELKYLGLPMGQEVCSSLEDMLTRGRVYLSTGDSAETGLPAESVDLVVTDPPFFDNVHYSELADFFYVWQRHLLDSEVNALDTTRNPKEVQSEDVGQFTEKLTAVLRESARMLRPQGLLIFTYHHSRVDGWASLLRAVLNAGLVVVATHPIKAELSVATPKSQAASPINLDVIIVCRRRDAWTPSGEDGLKAVARAIEQIERLSRTGRVLSRNDVRVVLMAQHLAEASRQQLSVLVVPGDGVVNEILDRVSTEGSDTGRHEYEVPIHTGGPEQLLLPLDGTMASP